MKPYEVFQGDDDGWYWIDTNDESDQMHGPYDTREGAESNAETKYGE